ncbi:MULTISPECIES: hypothetical protein [Stenotrophomonas]|uniref:hypothetical protein n=1 Tax=Stenotrophomonas TaxID=40323 RepID=UPI0015954D1E|nr:MULTISPECIES: hypothetical protein [Stenotrophomonas]
MLEEAKPDQAAPSPWQPGAVGLDLKYAQVTQGIEARTTINENGVAEYRASWTMSLDANGRVAGMLRARRAAIWEKNGGVIPIRSENRYLFVSEDGERLTEAGWQTAWGRMMRNAVKDGILSQDERFGLHSLKHRGVTDTKGDKKEASGHKTDAMMHVYDHSLPTVGESGEGA